jgi:formylglycine-generating enzyme required for sulfatase activity
MNIEISPKAYQKYNLNFSDAELYCSLLIIDGKNDWRLPTLEELEYIAKSKNDFEDFWHWTCTNGGKNFDDATRKWQYNTYDGDVWHASEIDKSKCYTRAVRSC